MIIIREDYIIVREDYIIIARADYITREGKWNRNSLFIARSHAFCPQHFFYA